MRLGAWLVALLGMGWLREKVPFLFKNLLVEPTSVDELARTAVGFAVDDATGFVVMDADEIIRKSHAESLATFMASN